VVHAVVREGPALELAGVEGYEGIARGGLTAEALKNVDAYLEQLADLMRRTLNWVPSSSRLIASGGGSFYFDRVVEYLGHSKLPEYQLVLRPVYLRDPRLPIRRQLLAVWEHLT
jgi:D-serine dehydratase